MAKNKNSGRPHEPQSISHASGGNGQDGGTSPRPELGPSNEEIAARAYEIYEREGRSDGRAMDHWLQAESELRSERQTGIRNQAPANPIKARSELPRSARQHQESASV